MMRSLFSGVSGLKVHQTRMDVIGNNIANINTIGFKSSRTTFSDMFSQLQSSAAAPTDGLGGVNAKQIGLGVNVESIDLIFTDSSPQQTGKNTDLALSGNGLFVLRNGSQSFYTRNGAFMFDEAGYYVMPGSGLRVQGWNATDGILNTNGTSTDIVVPVGKTMEAQATTTVDYSGNLNKESLTIKSIQPNAKTGGDMSLVTTTENGEYTSVNVDGENALSAVITLSDDSTINVTSGYYEVGKSVPITTLITVYDSLGGKHEFTLLLDKDSSTIDTNLVPGSEADESGKYTYTPTVPDGTTSGTTYPVTLNADGTYTYTDDNGTTQTVNAADVTTTETYTTNPIYDVTRTGSGTDADPYVYQYRDASGATHNVDEADVTYSYTTGGTTYPVTRNADGTYTYTDASGATQTVDEADVTMTYTDTTVTYPVTLNADGTYTYTDDSGATHNVDEADVTTTDTYSYTPGGPYSVTRDADGNYIYTGADGNTHTVDESDVTAVFDNRWRAYIAPDIGKKGPASDEFENSYTRSAATENPEADGSSTVGVMNNINYLYFSNTGQFISNGQDELGSVSFTYSDGNGAAEQNISVNFLGMTQYANSTTCFPMSDGNTAGILQSLAVDGNGVISGTYTNGLVRAEAQIAVAQFNNSSGLTKVGTTIYTESNNSGSANIKTIADFGLNVVSSALEMSNVDLATEFSDMIITQRGFQANSKMTTTSDEMLETLVNMKR